MHMADALLSPAVGGTMWIATGSLIGYCAHKTRQGVEDRTIPLMGVMGAFVFAAQMINFTIPGTGSSGHLGGGLLLAVMLGPYAGFLTMASVLTIQALLFADGGLLALGCNIFNLGFFPCFIAYPLIYRPLAGTEPGKGRILTGAIAAAVVALQLGAFGVVLETFFSGITELPFSTFVLLMQPIHLAIGVVEGFVTAGVLLYVLNARPEIINARARTTGSLSYKGMLTGLLAATLLTAGVLSWFASTHPDGLEWAMFRTSGTEEPAAPVTGIHSTLAAVQEKTALMSDYSLAGTTEAGEETEAAWPAVDSGTSVAGLIGSVVLFCIAVLLGFALKRLLPRHSTIPNR